MADENKTLSKEEAAAAKAAAKAAEKERKERIKRNKPKEAKPNIFIRIWNAIKRFFKDFKGTCKKVIWPDGKTVLKSSLVVLVCTLIIGIGVWLVDWGLSAAVKGATSAMNSIGAETPEETKPIDENVTPAEELTTLPIVESATVAQD
ncbi:MAG: preprotein translocase subunit SecE [Clostridia bacterium]|nr:preprotein translocase subunit SecE [Clostridia bacterium]